MIKSTADLAGIRPDSNLPGRTEPAESLCFASIPVDRLPQPGLWLAVRLDPQTLSSTDILAGFTIEQVDMETQLSDSSRQEGNLKRNIEASHTTYAFKVGLLF